MPLGASRAVAGPQRPAVCAASAATKKSVEEYTGDSRVSPSTARPPRPRTRRPETPAEHTAEVIRCLDAGATIIHSALEPAERDVKKAAQAYIDEAYKPVWKKHPHAILYATANFDPKVYHRTASLARKVQCGHHRHLAEEGSPIWCCSTRVLRLSRRSTIRTASPARILGFGGTASGRMTIRYILIETCKDLGCRRLDLGIRARLDEERRCHGAGRHAAARFETQHLLCDRIAFAGLAPPIPEALRALSEDDGRLDLKWSVGYIGA